MALFRKKCEYCKEKIDKGSEVFKEVKDPVFVGVKKRAFCCGEHANSYVKEVEEFLKKSKCGKSCCG